MSGLAEWVQATAHGECARLLLRFVEPLTALDRHLEADVGSFGARFRVPGGVLCEVSVFGELFIVRVGGDQSVEYRVRHEVVAMQALDHILERHVQITSSGRDAIPGAP